MLDLWYKNAVIYCLDVGTFMDSNGDGVGDFQGLADRLDHIEALGCTCVWLLPFYPSPNRDNGYDVTDYYNVHPCHGTLGDFVAFTKAAEDRGLRVIVDLVVNHTSIDHPWFQEARKGRDNPFHDWYVWKDEKPADAHEGVVFPGEQDAVWTYDDQAKRWYFHRFYDHQPDLNIANPAVKEEIDKIMGFWLQLGVSGFRVDAVPFLLEYKGLEPHEHPEQDEHHYLTELRTFLSWRRAHAILLGEANIPMDQVDDYFGRGDRMHMIFNFPLNQNLFLALARGEAEPVKAVMRGTPKIPKSAQWGSFLRNHDELDLGRLPDAERQECFAAFGPDPCMQLFDRGIRRRLAPMLQDPRRIKMAYSLMFALPGTPVLWYGEEIGMGDELSLKGRDAVRTPMQWDGDPNAGFSTAPPDRLVRPVVREGDYAYETVNVAAQRDRPDSLLEHVERVVRARRSCPEVGWGDATILPCDEDSVLALRYDWRGNTVVLLHNLADREVSVPTDGDGKLIPLCSSEDIDEPLAAGAYLRLGPYGFAWLRARGERR
ncbi:MAG TPA: alpha-amylase family protein [Beijerinckiaceae bacterium]|nr:alpha-amylase family protein [Beijerinckiaceae bacterium]